MALTTIESVQITVTKVDDTTETFTLAQPNSEGEDIFRFGFRKIPLRGQYRDNNLRLQKPEELYRFVARYNYQAHEMDLRPLFLAKSIELKVPPTFGLKSDYQTFHVRLANNEILRDYITDIPAEGNLIQESGPVELHFTGTEVFEWDQVKDFDWYQPIFSVATPTGLTCEDSDGTVKVIWDAVSNVDGYNIYINDIKDNDELITGTTYESNKKEPGLYKIQVTAFRGIESDKSDPIYCEVNYESNDTAYVNVADDIYLLNTTDGSYEMVVEGFTTLSPHFMRINPYKEDLYTLADSGRVIAYSINEDNSLTKKWEIEPFSQSSDQQDIAPTSQNIFVTGIVDNNWVCKKIDCDSGNVLATATDDSFGNGIGYSIYGLMTCYTGEWTDTDGNTFTSVPRIVKYSTELAKGYDNPILYIDQNDDLRPFRTVEGVTCPRADKFGNIYVVTAGDAGAESDRYILTIPKPSDTENNPLELGPHTINCNLPMEYVLPGNQYLVGSDGSDNVIGNLGLSAGGYSNISAEESSVNSLGSRWQNGGFPQNMYIDRSDNVYKVDPDEQTGLIKMSTSLSEFWQITFPSAVHTMDIYPGLPYPFMYRIKSVEAPKNFSLTPQDEGIYADWESTDPDTVGFNVYLDGTLTGDSPVTATEYTFTELNNFQEYAVEVRAIDENGIESDPVNGTATPNNVLENLESYYNFDGNVSDQHGTNDLNLVRGGYQSDNVQGGQSLDISGFDDRIDGATNQFHIDSDTTIAFWFHPTHFNNTQIITSKYDYGTNDREWMIRFFTGGNAQLEIAGNGDGSNRKQVTTDDNPITVTDWYFCIAWYEQSTQKIYLQINNGTVFSTDAGINVFQGDAPYIIGGLLNGGSLTGTAYDGYVDEFGFWNRLLDSDERSFLFNSNNGRAYTEFGN